MNSFEYGKHPNGISVRPEGYGPPPAPYERTLHDYGYTRADTSESDGFDPLRLLWYIVHYRWLITAFLTAGLMTGLLFTYLQTPLYRASTRIEIVSAGAKVLQDLEVVSQLNGWRDYETVRLKMLNHALARRVVFELNLTDDDKFLAPTPSFSFSNLINRATGSKTTANLEELSAEQRENMAVGKVLGGLSAELIPDSALLLVSYRHPDPKYAALVVNQVAHSYIDQDIDKTSETSDLARQFIQQQVRETKAKLQTSEQELVNYANQQGITLTGDDASLIAENISKLNAALAQAIQERVSAERFHDQIAAGNAATLPEVFQSASIQDAKGRIVELKASYREKLTKLKPGFPEMRSIQSQIDELQAQINLQIASIAESVEIRYQQTIETEQALKRELAELERQQQQFQDKYIQYTILKREVDSNRTQYDSLIAKLNDVGIGAQLKTTNASIVDLASPPGSPYSPVLAKIVLIAMAMFGVIAGGLIYILELLNNTFSVPDQIESELHLPVLGIIPEPSDTAIMEAFEDNSSALSEAYRTLRTSLQFTGTENNMRTLLVTSSEQSEGKSTSAYKLARDFASLGRRVLIIDADLRKPQLHRLFKTSNTMGLSNLLSNVVRAGDGPEIFRKTIDPNITLLSAGTIPPNPVDLLSSQRMGLVLHYCAKKYDLVVIDGPPVMGLSDAPILGRLADATLLIIAAKQVTRKASKTALARLKAAGANVVGAAFTKFSIDRFDYNYAYRYMHYNYYNYYNAEQIEDHAARTGKTPFLGHRFTAVIDNLLGRFRRRSA